MLRRVKFQLYNICLWIKFIRLFLQEYKKQKFIIARDIENFEKKILEQKTKKEYNTEHERFYS